LLRINPVNLAADESQSSLAEAASILRNGGTVAFPTETVYGLGANALSEEAVRGIFEAKQRPDWDPLIVHVSNEAALYSVAAVISQRDRALMEAFWPGPLTLLLPRKSSIPAVVTAGRPKVGVRMPADRVARHLIERSGLPIAAPSANSFGRTSPTTAQHVLEDLDGRIDAILDGGPTMLGLESTVIDANAGPPTIYRPGMISIERIRQILPDVVTFVAAASNKPDLPSVALPAPGVGLRHYAPIARLILVQMKELETAVSESLESDGLTGVMLPEATPLQMSERLRIFPWGIWNDPESLAQRLFLGLRELDQQGVVRIVCPVPSGEGVGVALRDRLQKAAKPREPLSNR
jgi:L-threonylcarbamoyladenylate synthase